MPRVLSTVPRPISGIALLAIGVAVALSSAGIVRAEHASGASHRSGHNANPFARVAAGVQATVLYSFQGELVNHDGADPGPETLLLGQSGTIYGTTIIGGQGCSHNPPIGCAGGFNLAK